MFTGSIYFKKKFIEKAVISGTTKYIKLDTELFESDYPQLNLIAGAVKEKTNYKKYKLRSFVLETYFPEAKMTINQTIAPSRQKNVQKITSQPFVLISFNLGIEGSFSNLVSARTDTLVCFKDLPVEIQKQVNKKLFLHTFDYE